MHVLSLNCIRGLFNNFAVYWTDLYNLVVYSLCFPYLPTCDEWTFPSLSFEYESTFIYTCRASGVIFHFSMKIKKANRIAPDGAILFAHVHKKNVRLI